MNVLYWFGFTTGRLGGWGRANTATGMSA
jgi:hypothetical protein